MERIRQASLRGGWGLRLPSSSSFSYPVVGRLREEWVEWSFVLQQLVLAQEEWVSDDSLSQSASTRTRKNRAEDAGKDEQLQDSVQHQSAQSGRQCYDAGILVD